jgi:hypothetical protein
LLLSLEREQILHVLAAYLVCPVDQVEPVKVYILPKLFHHVLLYDPRKRSY